ncbi:DUF1289 domain-containing protein [Azospirillum sp. B4]|uniref:DUF1289 domain-containing protein n=1 Tax=Azospirillum sp. B4 TaxID=95605 RepID=UPI0005CA00EE|nr:DUF1289 domain-containing protein [Azospirillum sp. B4]
MTKTPDTHPVLPDPDDYVASPCTRVCRIDTRTDLCAGCLRTLEEITHWGAMTPDQRRAVLAQVADRRQAARAKRRWRFGAGT